MAASGLVITDVQGVKFVTLQSASILNGTDIDAIGDALYELVDKQACRKLVVDFRAVSFLASQMLGVLIALDSNKVVFCGLRPKLMKVFKITRLDKRLTFAADETEAIGKLR